MGRTVVPTRSDEGAASMSPVPAAQGAPKKVVLRTRKRPQPLPSKDGELCANPGLSVVLRKRKRPQALPSKDGELCTNDGSPTNPGLPCPERVRLTNAKGALPSPLSTASEQLTCQETKSNVIVI